MDGDRFAATDAFNQRHAANQFEALVDVNPGLDPKRSECWMEG